MLAEVELDKAMFKDIMEDNFKAFLANDRLPASAGNREFPISLLLFIAVAQTTTQAIPLNDLICQRGKREMLNFKIVIIFTTATMTVSLSVDCLLAQNPDSWPDALPKSGIELKQSVRPAIPQESGLSSEFGLELLRNALTPNAFLNSGTVTFRIEKFLPPRLQVGRVHLIQVKLIFDRQSEPTLWAQWTNTVEKDCVFIRTQDEVLQVEQFPGTGSKQRIMKRNIDYIPMSKYCNLFPIFSFAYAPHMFINRTEGNDVFVENCLKVKPTAVTKVGEESYMIHRLFKNTRPQSRYSEFHTVWWITTDDPLLVEKMVLWAQLSESKEWIVLTALQTEYQEIAGIKVPKVYESYQFRRKDNSDDYERITFDWKEVNKPYSADLFSEKLLEPKATDLVFDVREKLDGVIGVPFAAPKMKTLAPRQPESTPYLYWVFVVNVIIVVLIAAYFVVRRIIKQK